MGWSSGIFSRTNGVYNGATVWAQDAAAAVKIVAARHDVHDQDLANGINASLNKNGQNKATASIDWGGYKITGLGAGTVATDAAQYGQTISAASLNSSSKVLTLTRPDGTTYTVDFTAIIAAADTSDFPTKSGNEIIAGSWVFSQVLNFGLPFAAQPQVCGFVVNDRASASLAACEFSQSSAKLAMTMSTLAGTNGAVWDFDISTHTLTCTPAGAATATFWNDKNLPLASVIQTSNFKIQNIGGLTISSSAPSGAPPPANSLWICTTGVLKGFYIYSGGSWVLIAS